MHTYALEVPTMSTTKTVPICLFIIVAAFVVILLTGPLVAAGCYLLGLLFGTLRLHMRQP